MGQGLSVDTAVMACLCSMMAVTKAGKPKGSGLELSEDFTGSEDLFPRRCTHMAGKLVLAVDGVGWGSFLFVWDSSLGCFSVLMMRGRESVLLSSLGSYVASLVPHSVS